MQHQNKYIQEAQHSTDKTSQTKNTVDKLQQSSHKNTAHHKQNKTGKSKTEHNTNKIAKYSPAKEKNTTDKILHVTRKNKLQIKQSMAQERKNKYIPLQKKKSRAEYLHLLCLRPSGSKYNASAINYLGVFFLCVCVFFYTLTLIFFFKGQKN